MSSKKSLAHTVQDAIDRGATTVEEVHKSIADLPLKFLEGSELLREPSKEVRKLQDRSIGAIYDLIREVNEKVGTLANDLLEEARRRRQEHPTPHAKKHAAGTH
jgi:hypothetical protein